MTPKIGITEAYKKYFDNYENAIKEHNGEVIKLSICAKGSEEEIVADLNGLLLPGGVDIHPKRYGEKRIPETCPVNKSRDEFEISLFKNAIEKDIPVFGICRGIQIMNVAMGGSLYQHIPAQIPETCPSLFPDFPRHKHKKKGVDEEHCIKIKTENLLSQIIGESTARVNSSHHQSVKVIGAKLMVTAQSKDGIIEAMEYPLKKFVIGVQYHPERMLQKPELREHAAKLFKAFINAASI